MRAPRSAPRALLLPLAAGGLLTGAYCRIVVGPDEVCTAELRVRLSPREASIAVGERFTARVELSSCGGHRRLTDTFTWHTTDARVVAVNARSGQVTALAPGEGAVEVTGARYGRVGRIPVTVAAAVERRP